MQRLLRHSTTWSVLFVLVGVAVTAASPWVQTKYAGETVQAAGSGKSTGSFSLEYRLSGFAWWAGAIIIGVWLALALVLIGGGLCEPVPRWQPVVLLACGLGTVLLIALFYWSLHPVTQVRERDVGGAKERTTIESKPREGLLLSSVFALGLAGMGGFQLARRRRSLGGDAVVSPSLLSVVKAIAVTRGGRTAFLAALGLGSICLPWVFVFGLGVAGFAAWPGLVCGAAFVVLLLATAAAPWTEPSPRWLTGVTICSGLTVVVTMGACLWPAIFPSPPQISSSSGPGSEQFGRILAEPLFRNLGPFPVLALPTLVIGIVVAALGILSLRRSPSERHILAVARENGADVVPTSTQ